MELPSSGWEMVRKGAKFVVRWPFLRLSYLVNRPILVAPLSVDLNITDRCNFACQMCYGLVENPEPRKDADPDILARLIADMKTMGIWYLTIAGGEPLLKFDLVKEVIRSASRNGIGVGVVTNGSLLDEQKLQEMVSAGLHRISLSLDGATAEVHDWVRQPGSFKHIMEMLTVIQRLRQQNRGRQSFRLHTNTVVMKQNFRQLCQIADIARGFGATAFYQPVGIPELPGLGEGDLPRISPVEHLLVTNGELADLESEVKRLISLKKTLGHIGNIIWQLQSIPSYFRHLATSGAGEKTCYAGFNTIHVNTDASISSCMFLPPVGNLREARLPELWSGVRWNQQRKLIRNCRRPCELLCYYPLSIPQLAYEFLFLPFQQRRKREDNQVRSA